MAHVKQDSEKLDFEKVWLMFQETDKKIIETGKQIRELGKQIGGLGNKFGSYNEGLFLPSVRKILENEFKCFETSPNTKFKNNGDIFEIDLVGYSKDSCYIVEIKSHLDIDSLKQIKQTIENFKKYKPEYKDKNIYGILTATHYRQSTYQKALNEGFYVIIAKDDLAELQVPDGFKAKNW